MAQYLKQDSELGYIEDVAEIEHLKFNNLRHTILGCMLGNYDETGAYVVSPEIVEELVEKTIKATLDNGFDKIVVAGGVSANSKLRTELIKKAEENNIQCYVPKFEYCTDNAAMIGSAAYYAYIDGVGISDMSLAPKPNLSL